MIWHRRRLAAAVTVAMAPPQRVPELHMCPWCEVFGHELAECTERPKR